MFKSLKIYSGQSFEIDKLLEHLTSFNYRRQENSTQEGDFSSRGSLVDIFPFSFELPIRIDFCDDKITSIKSFDPVSGNPLWEHRLAIILPIRKYHAVRTKLFDENFPINNFIDLKSGDYVVHNQYGIGRFIGFEKLRKTDTKEHLVIEYDKAEKLYVSVDAMHLVQKYIAFAARKPKLYRLGSREWITTKEKTRKKIQKLAWELLSLQALRMSAAGFTHAKDGEWQAEFEKGFEFTETQDQKKAAVDVKRDMESPRPMDRLLCGDVGYGKTEVAMRAIFKAVMSNKQAAYLVPTTILAEQHHHNFRRRLEGFPVRVELLCRFKTDSEQKNIIRGLAEGSVDIVIGTHRLLSDDVSFKDLGLVVIDEEQRFGVKAKEKLKKLRLSIDVLTLTATPIPRTLYMSLMGAKDLSVINTPPQNRLPIQTVVVEYDQDLIVQAVLRERRRKGQVFYLHNRVQDIYRVKKKLEEKLSPDIRIAVAHGQMHPKELEAVMDDFFDGKIDLLVCTMIIESGLDVPNANTIIVDDAQMFGLSDLHQLRGRVGRFDRSAFAYFLVPRGGLDSLDAPAKKRLLAIQELAYLGAGFNIAMEDLEIRGAGNLLGIEQHGFILAVGFDLYCRLLRESIENIKKAKVNP